MSDSTIFNVTEIRRCIGVSLMLSILTWYHMWQINGFDLIYKNYWNYVSLSATLLGFLITAFTILFAFPTNYKVELLAMNKNYPLLFDAFLLTIYISFFVLVLSLFGALIDMPFISYIYFIFIFFLTWLITSVGMIVWILKRMVDVFLSGRRTNQG